MSDADYERGYLQALIDLRVQHEFKAKGTAGTPLAAFHLETVAYLAGLIQLKEERRNRQVQDGDSLSSIRSMEP